ncbi:MAG: septal ring lytic transglycosylase RlpA family protein [Ferruginibacter sp.]|nr:septal ring lytic transglycosylase RlpA family protein [Ferruginibacter sp.]
MNTTLLDYTRVPKPVYYLLIFATMLFATPSSGQKHRSSKSKSSAKSSNRIIYGLASFYGNQFQGRPTASGEIFSQTKFTCACNMLPLGTWVKVTNIKNGRSVIVKVNDRLHPRMRRIADLSKSAAKQLGYIGWGITRVKVEVYGKKRP